MSVANSQTGSDSAQAGSTSTAATLATPQIPITELDIDVIRRLQDERRKAQQLQVKLLSTGPKPYGVGAGDVLQIVVWDHPEIAAAVGATQSSSTSPR